MRQQSITVSFPFLNLTWECDEREALALRNLANEARTRRALHENVYFAAELPVRFFLSIAEARQQARELVNALPPNSKNPRQVILTAISWLAEVDDAMFAVVRDLHPEADGFEDLRMQEMFEVMERIWPVVEDVRRRMGELATSIEKQLGIAA